MVERRVVNDAGTVAPALIYKLSLRSAWAARLPYNVFKAAKDISKNATADNDRNSIKHNKKLEIYYSLVKI